MSTRLYQGMGPPYVLQASVPATSEFIPTNTTSAVFHVTKPDGSATQWSAVIVSADANSVVLQQPLSPTLLDQAGVWRFWVECFVEGGSIRTNVQSFRVFAADAA